MVEIVIGNEYVMISGADVLVAELGYWPEFCDAKITELLFQSCADTGANLSLTLRYIDMDKNRDLIVKVVFYGVSNVNFDGLRSDNVIDKLSVSSSFEIEIESAAGFYGSCKCKLVSAELISVKPYQ